MAILDRNAKEVSPLQNSPVCDYCRIIQNRLNKLDYCQDNDQLQCEKARINRETNYYQCHAGLEEAIYPLMLEEEIMGYIIVGQFRTSAQPPDKVLASLLAQKGHLFSEKNKRDELMIALKEAYILLPEYDEQKIRSILGIIDITAQYIMEHKIVNLRENLFADKIIDFIQANIHRPITLNEAAEAVSKSPSTVSQTLKQITGKTFKQLYQREKIDYAETLMKEHPEMMVYEVAQRIGIDDPFYFSRMFRKQTGTSPREFRAKIQ